jgi:hypothetical protein
VTPISKNSKKGLLVSLIEVDLSNKKQHKLKKIDGSKSKSFILMQKDCEKYKQPN